MHENDIEYTDNATGEIKKLFVPICSPENIGEDMCVDEKQIGEEFYSIISNRKTGKLAFVVNTTKSAELFEATLSINQQLSRVKVINRDLASCYRNFCNQVMPDAAQVADKFHVIKLLLDAEQAVRIRHKRDIDTQKRLAHQAFKNQEKERKDACEKAREKYKKRKFIYNEKVLTNGETPSELLRRSRYLLYKYSGQWTKNQKSRANVLFTEYPELETAYQLSCSFRSWYSKNNIGASELILEKGLHQWYEDVEDSGIEELMNFSSTVERNQDYICNYFYHNGATNAMAENRNGKIKKFINSNQGTRDRDFFFFRLKKYYA